MNEPNSPQLSILYRQAEFASTAFLTHETPANKQHLLDALRTMRAHIDYLESIVIQITPTEAPDTGEMEAVQ